MASTQKCYGKGTCVPGPVPNGQIRIYSMRFCPFAQRTRLVLSAKGVKHETVNINLKDKPEWFLAKNPLGLVPTLETPFGQVIPLFYKIPGSRKNGEDVSALEAEFKEKLSKLNEVLVKKKTSFFGGNSVTMIDYLIWPWFERLEAWQLNHCLDGFLELKKWVSCMLEDPAVKDIIHNTDTHKAFFNSYLDGNPNYDYGL
ncbi:glutathione S-transferase omega-1 isoform X2 [Electrophorus electricus]|uniref:glutathione S-transferase omega-1 isoform X2 n=1 Tax=Electrophorus electricus TaxID=8005 RepID=UPI000F0A8843|nr:glutathione S-transferase omega-1 isoform X2 [Electrophorus electricus]